MVKRAAWINSPAIPKGLKPPEWSTHLSLEFMTRNNIGAAILSLSAPATEFMKDKKEAASLAREVNEYAASIRDRHPHKFGFFATLPSPDDTSGCLEEIDYALNVLKAEGVTLLTSYGKNYLGNPEFRPIWDELDRRNAVIFVHPTMNPAGGALETPYVPQPLVDFPHETTRTAVHLIVSNTVRDHPNCKIILSHGGGTLPYMATRVANMCADCNIFPKTAEEFMQEARNFYFDVALTAYDYPLDLLSTFAKPDHILYGSDFPFAREITCAAQIQLLDERARQMTLDEDFSLRRGAALELFPRLLKPSSGEQ